MTIGFSDVGMVTQAWARVISTPRIAQTEVIANASLRPTSGFALKRRAQKSAGIGPVRRRPLTNSATANSPFTNLPMLMLGLNFRVVEGNRAAETVLRPSDTEVDCC